MKKILMFLFILMTLGAFSCYAEDDWTGFQDGQFETIAREGYDASAQEDGDDEDRYEDDEAEDSDMDNVRANG